MGLNYGTMFIFSSLQISPAKEWLLYSSCGLCEQHRSKRNTAFRKVRDTINSCNLLKQLECCQHLIDLFQWQYNEKEMTDKLNSLLITRTNILQTNNCYETV